MVVVEAAPTSVGATLVGATARGEPGLAGLSRPERAIWGAPPSGGAATGVAGPIKEEPTRAGLPAEAPRVRAEPSLVVQVAARAGREEG